MHSSALLGAAASEAVTLLPVSAWPQVLEWGSWGGVIFRRVTHPMACAMSIALDDKHRLCSVAFPSFCVLQRSNRQILHKKLSLCSETEPVGCWRSPVIRICGLLASCQSEVMGSTKTGSCMLTGSNWQECRTVLAAQCYRCCWSNAIESD